MSINDAIEILEKAIEAQKVNKSCESIADMQGHKNEAAAKKSGNQVCAERILLPCM